MVTPALRRWLPPVGQTLARVAPGAVIVSWWDYSTPLWYAQLVEGRRPDLFIIDDRTRLDLDLGDVHHVIDRFLPTRPVYVIRIEPSEIAGIAERYVVQQIDESHPSMLGRVIRRREGGE